MKRPRITIFVRILLASLVPLVLIFCALIFLVNSIIFEMGSGGVRASTEVFARQVSERILSVYGTATSQLGLIGRSLTDIVEPSQDARDAVSNVTLSLMLQNRNIYSAWFAFEPGYLLEDNRYYRTFIQEKGIVSEIHNITDEILDDPTKSYWYSVPLYSGEPFFDIVNSYDFGVGEGPRSVCSIVYPVISHGRVIGCIGIDMLYESILSFLDSLQNRTERLVLSLSADGTILYAPDRRYLDRHLTELDFLPEDRARLVGVISSDQDVMMEIFSPFFREKSLVYLTRLDVPNAKTSLFLYLDQPVGPLYRQVTDNARRVLLVSIAGLALLTLSVFFVTRSLVRPITDITKNANLIASGRLDLDLAQDPRSGEPRHEVDMLNQALLKMYDQLKQNHDLKMLALEEEFRRKEAEEASEAKTRFFANMSHEIRTPMNAILGISEILLANDLGEKQRKYVTDIKTSSVALLGIINDILDISKLESGKLPLLEVDFDFPALIRNIVSIGTFLASEKGLEFRYEARGRIPQYLRADDVRLRQVLMNLIGNAVKFTSKGSVGLRVVAKAERLRFEVEDTGVGIREADLTNLFDAFKQAQADAKANRNVKGTGLGLSISMNLAKAMGGTISVESEYGHGSLFTLSIPRTEGDPSKVESGDEELLPFAAPEARVLIVDDNDINLDVAVGMIGFYQIACDTAESGERALEMVQAEPYDAVFMDHMMPGMDGIETTQAIRALGGRYQAIPVIALTANAVVGTRELFLSSGMDDFLSKPIERDKLQAILLKWIPRDKIRINA